MAVFTINGLDHTQDKMIGAMRWVDALSRSAKAVEEFPAFEGQTHQAMIDTIKNTVVSFINGQITQRRVFAIREDYPNTTYYQTHRDKLLGGKPGTAIKFLLSGYCNWGPKEAQKLDAIIAQTFPGVNIGVGYSNKGKPECIIHLPL